MSALDLGRRWLEQGEPSSDALLPMLSHDLGVAELFDEGSGVRDVVEGALGTNCLCPRWVLAWAGVSKRCWGSWACPTNAVAPATACNGVLVHYLGYLAVR
jgi:hypothetical protein